MAGEVTCLVHQDKQEGSSRKWVLAGVQDHPTMAGR